MFCCVLKETLKLFLFTEILLRFDDVDAKVRAEASLTLTQLFQELPEGLDPSVLQEILQSSIVYLDDPDSKSSRYIYSKIFNVFLLI